MLERPIVSNEKLGPNAAEAARKFNENGPLGVTAQDHRAIGSTPPDELELHPGKTLADLMTDDAIALWIAEQAISIKELSGPELAGNISAQRIAEESQNHMEVTRRYLESIGRPFTK